MRRSSVAATFGAGQCREEVRGVNKGARLLGDGSRHLGMRVTERGDGNPAEEVEIPPAVSVPTAHDPGPLRT